MCRHQRKNQNFLKPEMKMRTEPRVYIAKMNESIMIRNHDRANTNNQDDDNDDKIFNKTWSRNKKTRMK